jgi:hypothetical protein
MILIKGVWYFKNAEYPSDTKQNVTLLKIKRRKTIQFGLSKVLKIQLERQERSIAINRMNQKL